MSIFSYLKQARCGELSWLCCLPKDKLPQLHSLVLKMTPSDLEILWELVCACQPGQPGTPGEQGQQQQSGGGNPPQDQDLSRKTGESCADWVYRYMCSTISKAVMAAALLEIRIKKQDPTLSPPQKAILTAMEAAIIAILYACENPAQAKSTAQAVCRLIRSLKKLKNTPLLGDFLSRGLGAKTIEFFMTGKLADILDQCCDELLAGATVSDRGTWPDWLTAVTVLAGE